MVRLILVALLLPAALAHAQKAAFFNGTDLKGWNAAEMAYWSVEDRAIVGRSEKAVPKNEFLWSDIEVKDFYLVVDVKLDPNERNAGIQFRSRPAAGKTGQAIGYQADVGKNVWGKLYHEHGRGKLDWNNHAAAVVKPGDWNRYEILAVGHRIWTALNGTLCVALEDPEGELEGKIALQIHSGPPQTVRYRIVKLVHDPKLSLERQGEKELLAALPKRVARSDGWTPAVAAWRAKVDAADPGMADSWFRPDHVDGNWQTMALPREFEGAGLPDHDGTVWFRRRIDLPDSALEKDLVLELGPIDDMDMCWFNGTQIGGIEIPGFWTAPRIYRVPRNLLKAGLNQITVRVIDHGWGGGFTGRPGVMRLAVPGGEAVPLAGPWSFKAGASLKALGLGPLPNPPAGSSSPAAAQSALAEPPALLRPLARPESPRPAFDDGFSLEGEPTVAVLGGANAWEGQRHGHLEALLVAAGARSVRSLAWSADTVYEQQRPRNFYALAKPDYGEVDGRPRIAAEVLLLWFGRTESLDGPGRVEDFRLAYRALLAAASGYTERIVLVVPPSFEDPLGLGLDVSSRNESLDKYAAVIRELGAENDLPVVDLLIGLDGQSVLADGVLLSPEGHRLVAREIARQLGLPDRLPEGTGPELRERIVEKNRIWRQFWFPPNWAFLYGNRQSQPSSRDHADPKQRWFPEEVKAILPEVERLEVEIAGGLR